MRKAKFAPSGQTKIVATSALACALAAAACTGIIGGDKPGAGQGSSLGSIGPITGNTGTGTGNTGTGNTGASTGNTGTGGSDASAPLAPFSPAPESLHRLTKTQFQNSLNALLGHVTIGELDDAATSVVSRPSALAPS